jgi:drug/metabolite transporter (DMT)-like permease
VPIPIRPSDASMAISHMAENTSASVTSASQGAFGYSGLFSLSPGTWATILLPICALSFAGNHIVGRAVAGHVPPVALATGRWALASVILMPVAWGHLRRDWPQIRAHWPILLFLTLLAGGLFSTLQYIGLAHTTALNTALLNSTVPVFIAMTCFVLFGERLTWMQTAGIGISLTGVVAIISKGDAGILSSWAFSSGDLIILANMALWSVYSAFLRHKPAIHWLSFGAVMSLVALFANLPFLAIEHASGQQASFTKTTVAAMTYAGIITSIVAFATWNYGVAAIGASRAGVFLHLIPVFGSILAVMLLGEPAGWFHAAGFALILAGVRLAGR